jgi:hypothetical protein
LKYGKNTPALPEKHDPVSDNQSAYEMSYNNEKNITFVHLTLPAIELDIGFRSFIHFFLSWKK